MTLVKKQEDKRPKPNPIQAPDYMEADAFAVRAVADGYATPDQQVRAIQFIVDEVCGTYDLAFRPESDRLTNLALGKQRAGQIIVWFIKHAPTKTSMDKISARLMGNRNEDQEQDNE